MRTKKVVGAVSLALISILLLTLVSAVVNRLDIMRVAWDLPEFSHQPGERQDLMLAMRDGVKLRTLKQTPAGDGPWPAILIRNPYDTMGTDMFNVICELWVRYGYACVYQETRGQLKSEGEWEPLVNEPKDTSDTLYWMASEDWVDGNIGMWGVSYLALTQWAGAMDYPPELKTFMPTSMGTDFHKILYEKGNFRLYITLWVLLMPDRGVNIKGVMNFFNAAEHFPHNEIDELYAGKKLEWYQEWIRDVGTAAPTWQREDAIEVKNLASKLDIPVLIFEGWYDPFFKAELQDYQSLASREQSRMVIGPWSHIQQVASSLDLDSEDAMKMSAKAMIEWFDYYLKGNTSADVSAYISTFDIGANRWQQYQSWPPETEEMIFELANLGESNACHKGELNLGKEMVNTDETAGEASVETPIETVSFTYDPENPVPSRGGASYLGPLGPKMLPGAVTQEGFCERDDVLSFQSKVFEKDIHIAGVIKVNLRVSSDAEDTAFTAKLMDVAPDGTVINMRDSISTLSYRNDSPEPLVYTPGSFVDVMLDMWAIEWTLKEGHHLRLDVSSSNFPAYNIHSNYAGNWAAQAKVKTASQTLSSGSFVSLPVVAQD